MLFLKQYSRKSVRLFVNIIDFFTAADNGWGGTRCKTRDRAPSPFSITVSNSNQPMMYKITSQKNTGGEFITYIQTKIILQ